MSQWPPATQTALINRRSGLAEGGMAEWMQQLLLGMVRPSSSSSSHALAILAKEGVRCSERSPSLYWPQHHLHCFPSAGSSEEVRKKVFVGAASRCCRCRCHCPYHDDNDDDDDEEGNGVQRQWQMQLQLQSQLHYWKYLFWRCYCHWCGFLRRRHWPGEPQHLTTSSRPRRGQALGVPQLVTLISSHVLEKV
eukprot:CAMPEP_0206511322 /NCGR_PEP_ID=MMETSP0324_2-20121206/60221_1 /ASSEMBLY_ACC=CAM_ASM_000836 /TAXON_ID=2866 /ORGANISM="Crypthecodinium cohnii, Strain Seligo" /LENGTH=192 /DNA_ID=CAMNT_0054003079 /DNA_START=237 /DNA_END=816 /DNA_ORIENTATION=+